MRPLVILGAGGHATSVANVAHSAGYTIECFVDKKQKGQLRLGKPILGELSELGEPSSYVFAVAVGDNAAREARYNEYAARYPNLKFPPLIHASAVLSLAATVGDGSVVMPNATVGPNTSIGKFCIINTQSAIDHDSAMADYASLAPGAITGGNVKIGMSSAISIGAAVKHGVTIGDDTVVGANSYVNKDLPANCVAYGCPAKIIRNRKRGDAYLS